MFSPWIAQIGLKRVKLAKELVLAGERDPATIATRLQTSLFIARSLIEEFRPPKRPRKPQKSGPRRNREQFERDILLGKKIRQLRKIHGLSQEALGKIIGVSYQQVQKCETGVDRFFANQLPILAGLFQVDIAELFTAPIKLDTTQVQGLMEFESDGFSLIVHLSRLRPTVRAAVGDLILAWLSAEQDPAAGLQQHAATQPENGRVRARS